MRKVKVAAAFLCLFAAGISGGVTYTGSGMSVAYTDQSNQIVEMTAEAVTTAASIETTAIVTTAATASETLNRAARTTAESETSVTADGTTTDETAETTTETTVTQTDAANDSEDTETTLTSTQLTTKPTTAAVWTAAAETTHSEPQTVTEPVTDNQDYAIAVTEREYIMLCNVVGHEYGAAWVPTEEKALIVECIMNRVASPEFPDTIYDVLMQPGQFTGIEYLIEMETLSDYYVTQSVKDAVDLYLTHPEQFDHGYLFFSGDGYRSYFRTSY